MAKQLIKVRFELDPSDWHGHASEMLWAAPIANESRSFRIANSPFFTRGINHRDVVKAAPSEDGVAFDFEEVVERAGHSTYMLLAEADEAKWRACWNVLQEKGCSYESTHINLSIGRRLLLSVDVPPSADLFEVYEILKKGEGDSSWLLQEGYAHL